MTTATSAIVLALVEGIPTTTSRDVALHFSKDHSKVLRSIELIIESNRATSGGVEFSERNFALTEYVDLKGESRPAYSLTRDGFSLLAMGFTGKKALQFKLAYIAEFNRMEAALRDPAPVATITLSQQQTLKELAALVNATTGQSFGEIYSRLHNRFNVPRYQELHPSQFIEACEYLQAKWDGNLVMKLVMQHIGTPRMLMSFDHEGRQVIKMLRDDDVVMPYSAIPARIDSGDIPAPVVKAIAAQALNRMTGGQLAVM